MSRSVNAVERVELEPSENLMDNRCDYAIPFPMERVATEEKPKEQTKPRYVYRALKRIMDVAGSLCALIILSPLFLIIAVVIKLDSKGPVIYSQTRIGKDGKAFRFYKFRSMCVDADEKLAELKAFNEKDGPVFKIKDDPRITKFGKFLRRSSIDELPQLINIIRGDMTIVGPRPPLPCEVEQYTPYQMQRLSVKGGLTCYWQINGRSNLDFQTWVELDMKYIRESSILTDCKIILQTLPVLLKFVKAGAY